MQITSYNSLSQHINPFNDITQNMTLEEKQLIRKALLQLPSNEVPKVLQKIKKIPVDENYLKQIIQTIEKEIKIKKEGFEIYA